MLKLTKFPIIIVSSPRTGSCALAQCFSDTYGVPRFIEPDFPSNRVRIWDTFISTVSTTNSYILKFHSKNSSSYPDDYINSIRVTESNTKIRLRRRDVISQVTSFYIGTVTKQWAFEKDSPHTQYKVAIDDTRIKDCIRLMMEYNNHLDTSPFEFDYDLYYEDLVLDNSKMIPSIKPVNYDDIKNYVKYHMGVWRSGSAADF